MENKKNQLCYELLDIVEQQETLLKKKNLLINRLVNDNIEKECLINELIKKATV